MGFAIRQHRLPGTVPWSVGPTAQPLVRPQNRRATATTAPFAACRR